MKKVMIGLDHGAHGRKARVSVFDPDDNCGAWVNTYDNDNDAFVALDCIRRTYIKMNRDVEVTFN